MRHNERYLTGAGRVLLAVLMVVAIASCGGDKKSAAPFGSTIEINPDTLTVNGYSLTVCSGIYADQLFKITVLDPDGKPMNDTEITIGLHWAPNYAHPAVWFTQLYDVDTGGGAAVTVPYVTKTNEFGSKTVLVRLDVSCDYVGQLEAFSGSAYMNALITVN